MDDRRFMTNEEAMREAEGPRSRIVLESLAIMERIVNRADRRPATTEDWAPFADLVDQSRFFRVGNFGESVSWPEYVRLLVQWANMSWWQGAIWRIREAPAANGRLPMVYIETQERSNRNGPVAPGNHTDLESIAAYEFGPDDKIVSLRIYDQRPELKPAHY